ncbi:MAG: methylamine utilization protein MauJ [Candidatus Acidiferrales bacterium]
MQTTPWGVPGEEHRLVVAPIFKDSPKDIREINLRGERGQYRVQFLLGRPGYPNTKEREFKFIDQIVGTSHIKIAKPKAERGPHDIDKVLLQIVGPTGKGYRMTGETNDEGFLGKLVSELEADNAADAEHEMYGAITPFLSAWSMNADVPIHIETIQVTDLRTHVSSLRVYTPHFEMNMPGGPVPFLQDNFCEYASIYREGLNTNSPFYRFLCFYKIIESLIAKRGREAGTKRAVGQDPRREYEVIPETPGKILALLRRLYPWRNNWDELGLTQIFPNEVRGKKITAIRDKHFRPLRLGIAHALLDQGEITVILDKMEYIQAVNKWLPLCRVCARWMLLSDFPRECALAMGSPPNA